MKGLAPKKSDDKMAPEATVLLYRRIFGTNLREARSLRGISQLELAEKSGAAGRSHVARIESGQVNITFSTMVRLACAIDRPIEELIRPSQTP